MFYFLGTGPCSKSLLLRAFIAKSYLSDLQIQGQSKSEDVHLMEQGLKQIITAQDPVIHCGAGAAPLRFLALRASREKGQFTLTGTEQLFKRPQQELQALLQQLGSAVELIKNSIRIQSKGWKIYGDAITVSSHRSSQFASAILLNSWNFPKDIYISIEGNVSSYAYLQMTVFFLRELGMQIEGDRQEYYIPANQEIKKLIYPAEQDMSCLFAIAACAIGGGQVAIQNWPAHSLQPDFIFPEILQKIGFKIQIAASVLKITKGETLDPIKLNLKNSPDLFPILASLLALANGQSQLHGAKHLQYKESNRIVAMADLIKSIGRQVQILSDGLIIKGYPHIKKSEPILFNPKEDHRLAMAAGVLKRAGFPIKILNPKAVNKSFPNFWQITGINPST